MKEIAVALLLGFSVTTQAARAQEKPTTSQVPDREDGTAYFKDHLAKCPEHEVRCLWFLGQDSRIGMVMTLDLIRDTSYTVRDVYNWAQQNSKTQKIQPSQFWTIRRLVETLPDSDPDVDFAHGVHVAFWKDDAVVERVYAPDHLPKVLEEIYEIGRGELPENKNK